MGCVFWTRRLDFISLGFNSIIELPPVIGEITDDAYHALGKYVRSLGQNVEARMLKQENAQDHGAN